VVIFEDVLVVVVVVLVLRSVMTPNALLRAARAGLGNDL
jgi:hypothetical protein